MQNQHEENTDSSAGTKNYRPELSPATVKQLTWDLYGLRVLSCRELDSYDDRNFHLTVDPQSVENDHIAQVCPQGYVLKVLNSLDSKIPEIIEVKNNMILTAVKKGFPTPKPVPSITGQLSCLQPLAREHHDLPNSDIGDAGDEEVYLIRLMEYLPGTTLAGVSLTPQLSFHVGQYAAKLDLALKGFDDSRCPEMVVNWNLQRVPSLQNLIHFITDAEKASIVRQVIENFETKVLNSDCDLQKGIIHSDFNDHNILVKQENAGSCSKSSMQVCGILDFGDATNSFLLIEVAIAMSYMTLLCPPNLDPDEMAGHVLAGYLSEITLNRTELELIPLTICARFSQTLTVGFHRLVLDPQNEYCLVHANKAWPHLQRLWFRPASDTLAIWGKVLDSHGVKSSLSL